MSEIKGYWMMKGAAVLMLCVAAGCGGSDNPTDSSSRNTSNTTPEYSLSFTGVWRGQMTVTMLGQNVTTDVVQPVVAINSTRFLWIDPICPIHWTADSAIHSVADPVTGCPFTQAGCSFRLSVTSGTFVREGDKARASLSGTATFGSGCVPSPGTVYAYSMNTDQMTRTQGAQVAGEGDSLEAAITSSHGEVFSALSASVRSFTEE